MRRTHGSVRFLTVCLLLAAALALLSQFAGTGETRAASAKAILSTPLQLLLPDPYERDNANGGGCALLSDDFDAYTVGSLISGQDGWETWDQDPAWNAPVVDDHARSGSNSLLIGGPADIVHRIQNATSGNWTVTAYTYVPFGSVGDAYFIMNNEYAPGGPYSWAIEIDFWTDIGLVFDDFTFFALPMVYDRWAELRLEIDLTNDLCDIYYDGNPLILGRPWAIQGGLLEIQAIDLFNLSSTGVYFDDVSIKGVDITPPDLFAAIEPLTDDEDPDKIIKNRYTVTIEGNDNCTANPLVMGYVDLTGGATCDDEDPDFVGYPVADGAVIKFKCKEEAKGCKFKGGMSADEDSDQVLEISGPALRLYVTGEDDAGNVSETEVIERCPDF